MGFLKIYGKPIEYKDAEEARIIVKEHALNHALSWVISDEKTDVPPETKFGYEIEIHKVYVDEKERKVKIDLSGEYDIYKQNQLSNSKFTYQYEYGKWMIESKLLNKF